MIVGEGELKTEGTCEFLSNVMIIITICVGVTVYKHLVHEEGHVAVVAIIEGRIKNHVGASKVENYLY